MNTATLETMLQAAIQQTGEQMMHAAGLISVGAAILLSLAWMAAGVLRRTPEL